MLATGPLTTRILSIADPSPANHLAFFDAVSREDVAAVLAEYGRDKERRGSKLPNSLVLRLPMAMAFHRELDIPGALDRLAAAFGTPKSWRGQVPHSTSIAQARDRLGFGPVRSLFRRSAASIADKLSARDRWYGLVPVAIDGSMCDTPDTAANVAAFGRPGGRNGSGGFPKLRFVAMVSTSSHFVLGCAAGPCKGKGTGEETLARALLPYMRPDWLLLMDKGFCSYLWLKDLGDQPFFVRKTEGYSAVKPTKIGRPLKARKDWWVDYLPTSAAKTGATAIRVRLIRIKLNKGTGRKSRWVEFLTNLDPARFPYEVLVNLYLQRWEVEFAFREMKVDLLGKKLFRSKTPTRVLQELYGLLTAYNAVRTRMAEAAQIAGVVPRELSFRHGVLILRLASLNAIPTEIAEILVSSKKIVKRGSRSYPRFVKKPISKFAANRRRAAPKPKRKHRPPKPCAAGA